MKTDFAVADKDGDEIGVEPAYDPSLGAFVKTTEDGVFVAKEDAPAVALAILKAAGHTADPMGVAVPRAVYLLATHEERIAKDKEEAARAAKADEEKLAAEALDLFNATTEHNFADFPNGAVRDVWLRAARRAREIHS
ncbi:hypothetical protein SEA_TFORTROY_54 [Arthrobacter phage TforTroy]|uniref:Tail assembly chaperone n=1 Tax=Arthrobacter phage TforTroy TaxID=3118973 RepID=A0ABZ2CQL9_9CAUD